ncbi:hypothetical protein ACIQVE_22365 [Pseudomonas sp. NPDC098747]|uniref:hypothetical protein n=1 Tax=Pseudomonas sp. NPDC098747 TaxID=3364487 RepID=UPI00383A8002
MTELDNTTSSQMTTAIAPPIFSEAYNFQSTTSGVNSRTGCLQATSVLGTVVNGLANSVSYSLALSVGVSNYYSSSANFEIIGTRLLEFGFNTPRLHLHQGLKKIYFASGEVDDVELIPGSMTRYRPKYHRVNDLVIDEIFIGVHVDAHWKVSYKNGNVEYYDDQGYLTYMYSTSGAGLKFDWVLSPKLGLYPRLIKSLDSENELTITAAEVGQNYQLTIVEKMDGKETTVIVDITKRTNVSQPNNYYISRISLPNVSTKQTMFNYEKPSNIDYYVLKSIFKPTGEVQEATLSSTLLKFSDSVSYPVVEKLTSYDAEEGTARNNKSEVTYSYGLKNSDGDVLNSNNYSGWSVGKVQRNDIDNCIMLSSDYEYTVTETYGDRTIQKTYNRFHLLVKEETHAISASPVISVVTTYTYPLVAGNIQAQQNNFSFWTTMTTVYTIGENTRTETQTCTWDDYGNQLTFTQASGITQTNTYYLKDSTAATGCPPSPLFQRHLKESTTTPSLPAPGITPSQTKSSYTYTGVSGKRYEDPIFSVPTSKVYVTPSMTLQLTKSVNSLLMETHTYETRQTNFLLLGVKTKTKMTSGTAWNETRYAWSVIGQKEKVKTVTTYAAKGSEEAASETTAKGGDVTFQPSSGRIIEERSPFDALTFYEYDVTNMLTKKTSYNGSTDKEIESYAFQHWYEAITDAPSEDENGTSLWANRYTVNYASGLQLSYYLNRDGHLIFVAKENRPSSATPPYVATYANVSQKLTYDRNSPAPLVKTDTEIDYIIHRQPQPPAPPIPPSKLESTTSYTYQLGALVATDNSNSAKECIEYSIVSSKFCETAYKDTYTGSGDDKKFSAKYTTTYNNHGLVDNVTINYPDPTEGAPLARSNKQLETNSYDGYGRLTSRKSANDKMATTFTYDEFSRIGTQTNGSDTTDYVYSYLTPFMYVPVELESAVESDVVMHARRELDGFGRLIKQITPGATLASIEEVYTYLSTQAQSPASITSSGSVHNTYFGNTQLLNTSTIKDAQNRAISKRELTYFPTTKYIKTAIVNDGASSSLDTTFYPMVLPYDDSLAQIRCVFSAYQFSIQAVWAALTDYQWGMFNPINANGPNDVNGIPSPFAREQLGLMPGAYSLLISPPGDLAQIQEHYNLQTENIAEALQDAAVFTERAGLTFNQLIDMTAQQDYQSSEPSHLTLSRYYAYGEASPAPVTEYGQTYLANVSDSPMLVVPAQNITGKYELNFTSENVVQLADRAERLLRLQRQVKVDYPQLDWMIKNCNQASGRSADWVVDTPVLDALAEFGRLAETYAISANTFACFVGSMNVYAAQFDKSMFETLFTSPVDGRTAVLYGEVYFNPTSATTDAALICGGLGVTANELSEMASLAFGTDQPIDMNPNKYAQLYRLAIIPRMLGISLPAARMLWRSLDPGRDLAAVVAGAPTLETLDIIRQTESVLSWMSENQLDLVSAIAMVSNVHSTEATPEIFNFLKGIYVSLSSETPTETSLRDMLCRIIAGEFGLKTNIMPHLMSWQDSHFSTLEENGSSVPYGLDDFWSEINSVFSSSQASRMDLVELPPNLVRYSNAIGQHAMIAQWLGLTEQDLLLFVQTPAWFFDGAPETTPAPSFPVLLMLSRAKKWQKTVVSSDTEALGYFRFANKLGQTNDSALELLAYLHGWEFETVQHMNIILVHKNVYDDYPRTFQQLNRLDSWMRASQQLNTGSLCIDQLYQMSLRDYSAQDPGLLKAVADNLMASVKVAPNNPA